MTAPGRREAHKQRTRAALLAAAREMFAERGYEATTVRDIAEAAQVTERTFFRYFASKDDLVVGEVVDLLPRLAEAIVGRPAAEPPLVAFRNAVVELARAGTGGLTVLFRGPPALRPERPRDSVRGLLFMLEQGLAEPLFTRIRPAGGTRFQAEVLARAAVGALRTCLIAYHLAGGPARVPPKQLRNMIAEAFDVLVAGGPPDPSAPRT